MKKILIILAFIVSMLIVIPLLVLGGVGSGINISGIINNIPSIIGSKTAAASSKSETIKVFIQSSNKIEEMSVEDYVKGVVSAEMPVNFNIEALKAQAVAARTIAYSSMKSRGGSGGSTNPDADVNGDTSCQAWMSKEDRFKSWDAKDAIDNWKKIEQAVNSTEGLVLTYQGKLIPDVKYHSTSGGKTEDSVNVFGYDEPYLKSVDSPGEEEAPSYKSVVTIKNDEFIKRVKQMNSSVKISPSNLKSQIKIAELTSGGRVKTVQIGDKTFSGVDIRWAMGLKSASFTIQADAKNVTFNVRGYGHGVGMSQWGANEMGKSGKKYDEILKHYFQGIAIQKISEIK